MGHISVTPEHLDHLLADPARPYAHPYQRAFAQLAAAYRSRPAAEIVPLLRAAADRALVGFTAADLAEQPAAISTGARYELRVCLIGR